jgi:periplasmic protein TonB
MAPIEPTAPAPANATNHAADNPTTSSNAATASPAKAAEPALEQPSSRAQYLNNPKPSYPPTSKRLGEEGKVVIRVLISAEGVPSQAQIHKSSGFERLDQAALETVARWRFVPGKRGGVPEAMWFNVPINFVLD